MINHPTADRRIGTGRNLVATGGSAATAGRQLAQSPVEDSVSVSASLAAAGCTPTKPGWTSRGRRVGRRRRCARWSGRRWRGCRRAERARMHGAERALAVAAIRLALVDTRAGYSQAKATRRTALAPFAATAASSKANLTRSRRTPPAFRPNCGRRRPGTGGARPGPAWIRDADLADHRGADVAVRSALGAAACGRATGGEQAHMMLGRARRRARREGSLIRPAACRTP